MAEIERTVWVFRDPCGCAFGVLNGTEASTRSKAWKEFYEKAKLRDAAMDRGVTVDFMPFAQYVADVSPQMLAEYHCPHGGAS